MTVENTVGSTRGSSAVGLARTGSITLRAAFAISSTGDWIYKFAVPTLILRLTGSAVDTALAYVVEFIPYVIVGPFAGVIADRFSRWRVMVACDAGSCVLALMIAILVRTGHTPIAVLYACALALACTRPLYFPAFQGFLVETVDQKDRTRFNSWTQVTDNVLSLAGPVLGVSIVAAAGAPLATGLDALSFAVSASLVAAIGYRRTAELWTGEPGLRARERNPAGPTPAEPSQPGADQHREHQHRQHQHRQHQPAASRSAGSEQAPGRVAGVLGDLAAGLRSVAVSRAILAGTILLTLGNLAAFLIEGNLVYVLLHIEHYQKIALGVVFSAQGVGGILGAVIAPRLIARYRTGHLLTAGMAISAAAMVVQAAAPRLSAIASGQALEGSGTALIVVCWFSTVQRLIPGSVIGRFVAAVRAIGYATLPAGALLGAWLFSLPVTTRTLFGAAAALQLVICLVTTRSPLVRIE